jgi:hypothetical protein
MHASNEWADRDAIDRHGQRAARAIVDPGLKLIGRSSRNPLEEGHLLDEHRVDHRDEGGLGLRAAPLLFSSQRGQ